jgi:hypothetical protein
VVVGVTERLVVLEGRTVLEPLLVTEPDLEELWDFVPVAVTIDVLLTKGERDTVPEAVPVFVGAEVAVAQAVLVELGVIFTEPEPVQDFKGVEEPAGATVIRPDLVIVGVRVANCVIIVDPVFVLVILAVLEWVCDTRTVWEPLPVADTDLVELAEVFLVYAAVVDLVIKVERVIDQLIRIDLVVSGDRVNEARLEDVLDGLPELLRDRVDLREGLPLEDPVGV